MMNNTINQQDIASVDSLKLLKKRLTNYLTIGGIVLGTSFSGMNAANSVTMIGGEIASAADDTANTAAAMSANADYTLGSGNVSINTDSALITMKSLDSTGTASIVTMVGTGGLTISGAVTATADLTIIVNEEADNILSIGGVSGAVLSLGTGSVLNLTGAVTHGGTIIARDDGDGTVNISAATTQSGAIGATADDIGIVNISHATTIGAASFIRDLNITGDVLVDLTANMAIDTIDLTSTTSSVKIGALMVGATGSQTTVVTIDKFHSSRKVGKIKLINTKSMAFLSEIKKKAGYN